MNDEDPTKNFRDAIKCVSEAAKLHLKMGKASTRDAVVAALIWRYEISDYEAKTSYDAALELLDAIPGR